MSVAHQIQMPHEVVILASGLDPEAQKHLEKIYRIASEESSEIRWRIITYRNKIKTSKACDLLLEICESDYATIVGDDDLLSDDFFVGVHSAVGSTRQAILARVPLHPFILSQGEHVVETAPRLGYKLLGNTAITRNLAGVTALLPGGGLVFPVKIARELDVFASPIPVVLEDHLLSTRLLRRFPHAVETSSGRYLWRIHERQSSARPDEIAYDKGVVRVLRIREANGSIDVLLTCYLGFHVDLLQTQRSEWDRYYAGYLSLGGSRTVARFWTGLPSPLVAYSRFKNARQAIISGIGRLNQANVQFYKRILRRGRI